MLRDRQAAQDEHDVDQDVAMAPSEEEQHLELTPNLGEEDGASCCVQAVV